jgi:hypothetical protein
MTNTETYNTKPPAVVILSTQDGLFMLRQKVRTASQIQKEVKS